MARSILQLLIFLATGLFYFIHSTVQHQSVFDISGLGREFVPANSSLPALLTFTVKKILYCSVQCNQHTDCRTFDFDGNTKQCRLWDADTTTGSIVASPSKPQSSVGSIRFSSSMYANSHNQSCDTCNQSRYEICDANSSTCQCPLKTFWNGSMCLAQLLQNQTCLMANVCRSDLNLTCQPSCDLTYRCSVAPDIGVGQTVAGLCNASIGTGSTVLHGPWGIYVSPVDGTLYVADWDNKTFQTYSAFSRIGQTILSGGLVQPADVFVDSSGAIYMVDYSLNSGTVFIQRPGRNLTSFPAPGLSTASCYFNGLYSPYGIAVDQSGNIYVSLFDCYMVVKWAPNATTGTLAAGQQLNFGSTSSTLKFVTFIHVNDAQGALYVCDYKNNRIQKFIIGGSGTGITVAGDAGAGTGLNQLDSPRGIWVTRDGQTLYVADYNNNRVMKWTIGATQGSVVAGSAIGVAGKTTQLLNGPGAVALDPSETYLYVSDYNNHRVQRFRVQ